jgi:hypothetical protein
MKRAGRGGAWGGLVLAALLACVGGGEAAAQEGEGANKPPEKVIKDTQSVLTEEERRFLKEKQEGPSQTYTILPRFRLVSIPDAALGLFLERHSESWGDGPNLAYGLEFLLQNPDVCVECSGLEFADISSAPMTGFWSRGTRRARRTGRPSRSS